MMQVSSLQYECFHVVARNLKDNTYYVGYSRESTSEIEDFCWCKANQILHVGRVVHGYLSKSSNSKKLPMLVINN
jgi:hypothetical protein